MMKSPLKVVMSVFNFTQEKLRTVIGRFSIIAAVALLVVNIPWVIISTTEYVFARHRYTLAKDSLLAGTSSCVVSTSKLQRAMQGRKIMLIGSSAALALIAVALPATVAKGSEAKFFFSGLADLLASLGADHEALTFFANLYNSLASHKNLKIDDQSYKDLITG